VRPVPVHGSARRAQPAAGSDPLQSLRPQIRFAELIEQQIDGGQLRATVRRPRHQVEVPG
jgi:hypothetical protein